MTFQLAYSSIATCALNSEELKTIMLSASNYNASKDITGSLIFYDGIFFQILEGKREEISTLMKKIRKDERHKEIEIVWTGNLEQRSFENWSMRYIDFEKLDQKNQEFLKQLPTAVDNEKPNLEIIKILAAKYI